MLDFLRGLFSSTSSGTLKEYISKGAVLLDVRTKGEFNSGCIEHSKNIPLDDLEKSISQLDKEQTFVVVCASGMRSRNAVLILKRHGFLNVYNGGSWTSFL